MIVVDTSVWIDHFRRPDPHLAALGRTKTLLIHPFVIGELAAGNLHPWRQSVAALSALPKALLIGEDNFYQFVESAQLMGRGLNFVDLHLLASINFGGTRLWTRDKRLNEAALRLGFAYQAY